MLVWLFEVFSDLIAIFLVLNWLLDFLVWFSFCVFPMCGIWIWMDPSNSNSNSNSPKPLLAHSPQASQHHYPPSPASTAQHSPCAQPKPTQPAQPRATTAQPSSFSPPHDTDRAAVIAIIWLGQRMGREQRGLKEIIVTICESASMW
jgi:hypothetical protein